MRLARRSLGQDLCLDRFDPVLVVGVIVQIGAAGRAAEVARHAADQIEIELDNERSKCRELLGQARNELMQAISRSRYLNFL
jgi:hypothetical protein